MAIVENELNFVSFDGLSLSGTLARARDEPVAAILLIHGITSDRNESGFYSRMAEAFSNAGVESLRFEYRCHGNSDLSSEQMTLSGIVNDIEAAFQALRSHSETPEKQFFVLGTSFGGGLAAFWCSRNSSSVKKLFLCAPVIDYFDDMERNVDNWRGKLRTSSPLVYAGAMPIGRALVNEVPFINGITAMEHPQVPVVIFHGEEDEDVPIESSIKYEGLGGLVRLVRIAGVGHGFGAAGDEDFETLETALNHSEIYASIIHEIKMSLGVECNGKE